MHRLISSIHAISPKGNYFKNAVLILALLKIIESKDN